MSITCSLSAAQKIRIYQLIIVVLAISLMLIGYQCWQLKHDAPPADELPAEQHVSSSIKPPYYNEIMEIIQPLRYSGIPAVLNEDVNLSINFDEGTWTLHNIHRYNDQGEILLEDNHYGLCGELASYTYNKIYPIIKDHYQVKFVQAAESGFFLAPISSHIVLLIFNEVTGESYMLDPSFQRYGPADSFDNYLFFEHSDTITGLDERDPNVSFPIETGTPLLIHNNFISSFSVGGSDQKFDKNNFTLAIKTNKKYHYAGRYLFAIRKKDGMTQIFENDWINMNVLSAQDIEQLKKKVIGWFYHITGE